MHRKELKFDQKLRLGELFCGPGGIGLGASMVNVDGCGFEHVWATDYDKDTCRTYEENLHPEKVICTDIRKFDFEKILKKYGSLDCITFGFPCNDFSTVGEQKGLHGAYGALYKYCVKALDVFKPSFFVAENVSGLRNANEGSAFKEILKALETAGNGYRLYPHLYKFDNYGVPQKRQRVIIVGISKDVPVEFKIPSSAPFSGIDNSVRTALSNIAPDATNNEFTKQSEIVVERLKHIKEGENAFTADIPPHLQLNVKGAKISQIYKRLTADEPAYTITGSGGGGTHVYHYAEHRALTNRERARLQSFPDDFKFYGSKESVRKQIGMAVPPVGIKIILEALVKSIHEIPYESLSVEKKACLL